MKTPIAVLGATGTVGQKILAMLENHPHFEVAELSASERSNGKLYSEACNWRESADMPEIYSAIKLKPHTEITSPFALSALPSDQAKIIEKDLAKKGIHVVSNASTFRMDPSVPLCIPELNGDHLSLVNNQADPGKIITNPNCATVFITLGLKPLMAMGEIERVSLVTLQAISGAGYPGVSSNDILGNIIPNIHTEEEKIEEETKKILGSAESPANFPITVHVHRVPVSHGHTVAMHVTFKKSVNATSVEALFRELAANQPELYKLHTAWDRPQPLRDITPFDQRAHIGRIKQGGDERTIGLLSMGHNLVRGAAGAALVNLEAARELLS